MRLFPASWRVEPANDVCDEVVDCLNKTAPTVERDTGFKMIRTTNVKGGRVDLDNVRFVEEAVFRKWTRRLLPRRNDVVLTREAPLGEVGLLRSDDKAMLGQRTMVYRADGKSLDQVFLYYSLLGPVLQAQIKTLGSGSTVEHMRVPDAENLSVPLPPLGEQRKIAAMLSAYDDLIENNRRRIALLERMAEQLYREWFVRFRFPGYQQVKFLKGIPSGWETALASHFFGYVRGKSYTSEELSDDRKQAPFITLKSFNRGGGYRADGLKRFSGRHKPEQLVRQNDIVMAVTDMTQGREVIGRVARVPDLGVHGAVISMDVIKLVPKTISASFLYSYLRLSGFGEFIKEFANGTNVLHLKPDLVTQQTITMPPEELRDQFSAIIEPIFEQIDLLSKANAPLKASRDLLLSRLISGKLRVDDLDIRFPPSMQAEGA